MKRVAILLLAILPLSVLAAGYQDPGRSPDPHITEDTCTHARTQREDNACTGEELKRAQADLDATFNAAVHKWRAKPDTVDALEKAQSLWQQLAALDVDARFTLADATGTMYPSARNSYESRLIRQRITLLCEFLRGPVGYDETNAACPQLVTQEQNKQTQSSE